MTIVARLTAVATLALVMLPNATRRTTVIDALPNDNRVAAGTRVGDTLVVALDVTDAAWHPEGPNGRAIRVPAFAEHGKAPSVPGPMLRVSAGTFVRVTLANRLDRRVVVRGLQDRAASMDSVVLAPGETHTHAFRAVTAGTYMYLGHTTSDPREITRGEDAELVGAFIVDSAGSVPNDRVLVITAWDDTLADAKWPAGRAQAFAINGRSWPHTERLTYAQGDTVRWRVLNASSHFHPMHLHGFFFTTLSQGTSARDTLYAPGDGRVEVTHAMRSATTITMQWVADRPGNWLWHCHMISHIATDLRPDAVDGHAMATHDRVDDVMSGLVVGITVRPRDAARAIAATPTPRRSLALRVVEQEGAMRYDDGRGARSFGPTLVLHAGEPTRIVVRNAASHATAVHWHGLEVESWYDGVPGWSGSGTRTAPTIAPGDSFVVRLTPRRVGTYIYHTHADERAQLGGGLYGALVVLPSGQRDRDGADRIALLSEHGIELPDDADGVLHLDASRPTRVRLVGIPASDPLRVRLARDTVTLPWTIVGKDGDALPPTQVRQAGPIAIGAGETYDVLVSPDAADGTVLELTYTARPTAPLVRVRVARGHSTVP